MRVRCLCEGKIRANGFQVGFGNQAYLAEITLPLAILGAQQVTFALLTAQNLAGTSHLKTLGDCLSRFRFGGATSHGTAKLSSKALLAILFSSSEALFLSQGTVNFWKKPELWSFLSVSS